MNKPQIFISSLLCVVFFSLSSFAQEIKQKKKEEPSKPIVNIEHEAIKGIIINDVTYIKDGFKLGAPVIDNKYRLFKTRPFNELRDLYQNTGYINLNHLYWKAGALDINENENIDAFLLLTQCKRVGASYGNDFEWNALRTKTRKYIIENKKNFPKKFKFVQPLYLGEYDFKMERFKIKERYAYNRSRRFLISNNQRENGDFCIRDNFTYRYTMRAPYNVAMSTNRPFIFTDLPMSKGLSKLYIDYLERNKLEKKPIIIFYISLELFQGTKFEAQAEGGYVNEFSGAIDYVEVYADKEKTRLLYKMDLR